jgi:hypothetical protein
MGAFTTAGKNEMLDASSITHAALFNGDPESGGTPIAGARQACTLIAASGGSIIVTADATFAIASGETVNYVGYYDALTGGNLLAKDDVTAEGPYGSAGDYVLESSTFTLS